MLRGMQFCAVVLCALASALVAPAQAAPVGDAWSLPNQILKVLPSQVVSQAPSGIPLAVNVTRVTATGPAVETITATSRADAERIVAAQQKKSGVIAVSMNQRWTIAAAANDTYRTRQWALSHVKAESVWKIANAGNQRVAVLDTGVWSGHPDLKGRVLAGYDAVRRVPGQTDVNGHGTHVAGIIGAIAGNSRGIAGLGRGAMIMPVRVLGADGSGSTADIAHGIRWAANNGSVRVINLSLSGTGDDPAVASAVQYAQSKNIVVVAAAGNSGCRSSLLGGRTPGPKQYPAAYPDVVGVGSVNSNLAVSSFSTCGPWVDVTAPGGSIFSTNKPGFLCGQPEYCSMNGTSMATAYVSAEAILVSVKKGIRGKALAGVILRSATDRGPAGRDIDYGFGLMNPLAALK